MNVENRLSPSLLAVAVLLASGSLAGCNRASSNHRSSQVVATVNDKEITVAQLNQALRAAKVEAVTPEVTKQAIDSLVAEELLVQDALRSKLDRDPGVLQAIEQSQRQVLAQAFAEKRLFARAPPTMAEIEEYYRANPILFANRKLFRFTSFSASKPDITEEIRNELNDVHSLAQVRSILDKHAIRYATQISTVSPEQIPMERLPAFAAANVGDLLVMDASQDKVMLMSVTSTEDTPIALAQATPMISEYLINTSRKEALAAYIKQSRAAAKIAYTRDGGGNEPTQAVRSEVTMTRDAQPTNQGYAGLN
jgi:EpsD family peptidyl-prolyl cis-trans isomerase